MRYLKPLVPVALMIVVAGAARAETVAMSAGHANRQDALGQARGSTEAACAADCTPARRN